MSDSEDEDGRRNEHSYKSDKLTTNSLLASMHHDSTAQVDEAMDVDPEQA